MVTGTVLVILFAPLFFVLIEKTFGKRKPQETATSGEANPSVNE